LAPLAALVLLLGFWPRPLLSLIDKGSLQMHRLVDEPGPAQIGLRASPPSLDATALRLASASRLPAPGPAAAAPALQPEVHGLAVAPRSRSERVND